MVKKRVKVLILRASGINCDYETFYAFKSVGSEPKLIHINRLLTKEEKLEKYDVLVIPGGFSYGDDISAGKVFSNELKYKLKNRLNKFVEEKKPVIGICNGFQVLVKLGLLPRNDFKQVVTLANNDSGKFECCWVYLKKNKNSKCKFIKNLPDIITLPVAHAEGKFVPKDEDTLNNLKKNEQIVFQYSDETGELKGFPYNPNGSIENIAGICNEDGNVFGLMPHPERYIIKYQHPQRKNEEPFGLLIFRNIVREAR